MGNVTYTNTSGKYKHKLKYLYHDKYVTSCMTAMTDCPTMHFSALQHSAIWCMGVWQAVNTAMAMYYSVKHTEMWYPEMHRWQLTSCITAIKCSALHCNFLHSDIMRRMCDKLRYCTDRQTRAALGSIQAAADNSSDVTQIQTWCKHKHIHDITQIKT